MTSSLSPDIGFVVFNNIFPETHLVGCVAGSSLQQHMLSGTKNFLNHFSEECRVF